MDANAAPPEPPAGAEAATQPSDANATPPAPPQPFDGLLETIREERQQDRKIRLMEYLSKMAIFQAHMQLSMPAEQRAAMAAHNNLSLEEFDRQLEEQLAFVRAQAGSMSYGVLRNESLDNMKRKARFVPSQAWWEEDGAFIAETESEMVAAAKTAIEGCAAATEGQACYICMDDGAEEGLVRGCSCRGGSGFAHISCLARQANIQFGQHLAANQRSNDTRDVFLRWVDCRLCEQTFHGPVAKAMARACVSTYASREPDDGVRISVMIFRDPSAGRQGDVPRADTERLAAAWRGQSFVDGTEDRPWKVVRRCGSARRAGIFREAYEGNVASAAPSTMKRSIAPAI